MKGTTTVYKGRDGDWHWRAKTANARVVADSGEGYRNRATARRMAAKYGPVNFKVEVQETKRAADHRS